MAGAMTRLRLFFLKKIGLVVLHGARQAHLDFGHHLRSRAAARKNQARQETQKHKIKSAHVGVQAKYEVAAAGLEHTHHCKKACVSATAQCVP